MNTSKSQMFVIFAYRRTGSNYLMNVVDSFQDIEFLGEIFHLKSVWAPYHRKQEFVEWIKLKQNLTIEIGKKPFEDMQLVKIVHEKPGLFLDFLQQTSKKKYIGFKIFPEHLQLNKITEFLLDNQNIKKIILKRNLLDVYVSDLILQKTQKSQAFNTDSIKVKQLEHKYKNSKKIMFHSEYVDNADVFIRREHLSEDLHKILSEKLNIDKKFEIPKQNITHKDRCYWKYYSKEAREMVHSVYQPYLEKFGYVF